MLYPGTNSTNFGHPRPDPGTNGAKSSGYKPGSGKRTSGGICRGPSFPPCTITLTLCSTLTRDARCLKLCAEATTYAYLYPKLHHLHRPLAPTNARTWTRLALFRPRYSSPSLLTRLSKLHVDIHLTTTENNLQRSRNPKTTDTVLCVSIG